MGLMDKVKAQATQLAQKTQEAALEGKAKLDQAQASRRGDALLRSLGAAVFAERTGRGTPDSAAKIDKLIADISAHERENGLNLSDPPPAGPPQASPQPGSPAGSAGSSAGQQAGPVPGDAGPADAEAAASSPDPAGNAVPDAGPAPQDSGGPTIDTTTSFFPGTSDPS